MKYIYSVLHIIFFLFFITCSSAYSYSNIPMRFNKGEILKYDIKVFNIKVAEQRTVIKDIITLSNRKAYYIYTTIKTTPIISKIYKLDDVIETYLDTKTFLPILIKKKISEGNWKNNILINIDTTNKLVHYKDKKRKKIIKYNKPFFGLISIIYFFRTIQLLKDEIFEFSVLKKREMEIVKTKATDIKKRFKITSLNKKVKCKKYIGISNKKANLWITA